MKRKKPAKVQALVNDALASLAAECPEAHEAMKESLGDRQVRVEVDGESFPIAFATSKKKAKSPRHPLFVQASSKAMHDLLSGTSDALGAILNDKIVMHGDTEDLIAVGEAALFFAKGALRMNSRDQLLTRLKQLAEQKE